MRSRTTWMLVGAGFIATAVIAPAALAGTAAPAGWQVAPSPNPGGSAALAGVSAASAANFWAVGVTIAPDSSGRPLILHQSGTGAWKAVDVPALRGVSGRLAAVSAHGTRDIWAVGSQGTPGRPLAVHFDGHQWKQVPTPPLLGSGAVLNAVSARSATDVWAVGSRQLSGGGGTLVEHWNGHSWQLVPSPNADTFSKLNGVVALAANDVWAVGQKGDEFVAPIVEHWDGHAWSLVTVPVPTSHEELIGLRSVSAVNARDIWAVGDGHLTEHWNGHQWTLVPAPAPSTDPDDSDTLSGVSARSSHDVWAVGLVTSNPGPRTVTLHWDGTRWTRVPSPTPSAVGAFLAGVTAPPGGPTVAVGYRLASRDTTLVLRNSA